MLAPTRSSLPPNDAPSPDAAPRWRSAMQALGSGYYSDVAAEPIAQPHWVATSAVAARDLGIDAQWLASDAALQLLAGNAAPEGSPCRASVYSGHQFGVWAGQLGDGRALLLGEIDGPHGPMELQLKGSGRTPYSRMGDGRAVLRSSIREFLASEAMHALGIPTTRALALVGSPLPVQRETMETAAVLTRASASFLRFGHFEHFAARGDTEALRRLADHVIERFYPACASASGNPYAALLQAVSERSAALVAQWQAVGFCHGVLNTDNMSILGLTIDYGPFQFLDAYVPGHICNHSDHRGRYAFDRQPGIVQWNLFALGQALLPLIGDTAHAQAALASFPHAFEMQWLARMRAKLGLVPARPGDADVVDGVLGLLAAQAVDYPLFWHRLTQAVASGDFDPVRALFSDPTDFNTWLLYYLEHKSDTNSAVAANLMQKSNPWIVLRNYLAEQAIRQARLGDFSEVQRLQTLLEQPFAEPAHPAAYAAVPPDWAADLSISCSS